MKYNTPEISINQGKSPLFNNTGFVFFSETPPAPVIKKKKRTFTREEQYEHGPERKKSFNRRWKSSKKEREELGAIYPDRHLFAFDPSWYSSSSNKTPANKNYINNIYISENVELGRRNAKAFENISWIEIQALRNPYQKQSPHSFFKHNSPTVITVPLNCTVRKEEKVMNENPVREAIRNCTMLNLSKWGQLKLMAFPDEAIQYAYKALASANPRDPFKWFISLCLTYCKQNSIAPDWNTMLNLCREHGMPDNAPMTLGPLLKPVQKTPKQDTHRNSTVPSHFADYAHRKEQERLVQQAYRTEQIACDEANAYDAAKKIEIALHDPIRYEGARRLFSPKEYNPFFGKLTVEQQQSLIAEVHTACSCDKSFICSPSVTKEKRDEYHENNSNNNDTVNAGPEHELLPWDNPPKEYDSLYQEL